MSVYSINETLSGLGLTSSLKIFYDFSSFSGSNVISSVSDGDYQYSGEIINHSPQFTGQNSGSGYFTDQYIKIQNTTGITNESCTIIFSQEKTGVGAGTLFSNFDAPSGFEIGIADSNKLYYKNIINGALNYSTLESYPSDKNLYAFRMSNQGGGSLGRLNFAKPVDSPSAFSFNNSNTRADPGQGLAETPEYYAFTKKNIVVPGHTVSMGESWKVGTGEFLYQGYMDYFMFFDSYLSDDTLRRVARAVHAETQYIEPETGIVSGSVTGYISTPIDLSGIVGTSVGISGTQTPSGHYTFLSGSPLTGAVGISGEVFVPNTIVSGIPGTDLHEQVIYRRITNLSVTHTLTGNPIISGLGNYYSSGSYWTFSGNSGTFNGTEGVGPVGTLVGITGFEVSTVTGYNFGVGVEVVTGNNTSGVSGSGYSFTELREPDIPYTGTGGYFSSGPNRDSSYYASALSLVGPPDPSYRYEIVYDISGARSVEQEAVVAENSTYDIRTVFMTGDSPASGINLYINGISSFTGEASFSTNQFNFPVANVISGFVPFVSEILTNTIINQNDEATYDLVPNREREQLTITNVSQYAGSPFSEITATDNDIFFNGVKLMEGTDYDFAGGFAPKGQVITATGVYFTCPSYSGDPSLLSVTGFLNEPISVEGDEITPHGYVVYFNGVRQPTTNIIEHGKNSDLITGTNKNITASRIYQMENGVATRNDV